MLFEASVSETCLSMYPSYTKNTTKRREKKEEKKRKERLKKKKGNE